MEADVVSAGKGGKTARPDDRFCTFLPGRCGKRSILEPSGSHLGAKVLPQACISTGLVLPVVCLASEERRCYQILYFQWLAHKLNVGHGMYVHWFGASSGLPCK